MPTVATTFTDAVGDPAVGYIQFTPRQIRRAQLTMSAAVAPIRVRVPLVEGAVSVELEPGDYHVAIVLQGSRTVYTVATVPVGAGLIDLRTILGDYMPAQVEAAGFWAAPGNIEWAIPFDSTFIDYVLLGAGAGGDGGSVIVGPGGGPGAWVYGTLERGVDIPTETQAIMGHIGAPGGGGTAVPANGAGGNGGSTSITFDGIEEEITAAGGTHGVNIGNILGVPTPVHHGLGVAPLRFNNRDYGGGGTQLAVGGAGYGPGGGGAGGLLLIPGAPGAPGALWLRAY
ncbi:MAG: hypothetical protein CK431_16940 [Mycobacterium sp.]|nr:MAG: hypothetical protein CK431_16940 [Mycobacterium sp.]